MLVNQLLGAWLKATQMSLNQGSNTVYRPLRQLQIPDNYLSIGTECMGYNNRWSIPEEVQAYIGVTPSLFPLKEAINLRPYNNESAVTQARQRPWLTGLWAITSISASYRVRKQRQLHTLTVFVQMCARVGTRHLS